MSLADAILAHQPLSPVARPLWRRLVFFGFIGAGGAILVWAWKQSTMIDMAQAHRPPSWGALLGCDALGRDLLARLVQGASVSTAIGSAAALIDLVIGTLVGSLCLLHPRVDRALLTLLDVAYGLPYLVLAAILSCWSASSWLGTLLALVLVGWISAARLMRSHLLTLVAHESIVTARLLRVPLPRLVLRFLLPLCRPVMMTHLAIAVPQAMLTESLLSYLGLGVRPPLASLGSLCQEGLLCAWDAPWMAIPPIAMLMMLQLAATRLSDDLSTRCRPLSLRHTCPEGC